MVAHARLLACRNLDQVARLVARQPRHHAAVKALRRTREKDHHYLLCAPAITALAIALLDLPWPEGRPLRLALLGAGRDDFLDRGQWYRFVPAMLGHERPISVHAFDHRGAAYRSRLPHALSPADAIETSFSGRPLADAQDAPAPFDLALSLSPLQWWGGQAESNARLMRDLKVLSDYGTPLVFGAFSTTYALLLHAVFAAFGAEPERLVESNPFALVSKRYGEQFCRELSYIPAAALPAAESVVDEELLEMLTRPAEMVLATHRCGHASRPWPVGTPVSDRLVHTMGGIAVDLDTLECCDLATDRVLGCLDPSVRPHFEDYDPSWSEVDRFIWAGHVRYIAAATAVAPMSTLAAVAS